MTTLAQATKEPKPPGATLVLEPWVFADDWSKKPTTPVCVGIRLLAEGDKTKARATAEELADSAHKLRDDAWIDCYNDSIMRQVVALGICDPNDVKQPFDLMRYAEVEVSDALSTPGVKLIFGAIERHEIATSAVGIVAGSDEFARLGELVATVDPEALPVGLRRLLAHVAEQLEAYADD